MRPSLSVVALVLASGCGGAEQVSSADGDEVGATRASPAQTAGAVHPALTAEAEETRTTDGPQRLVLRPLENVDVAEDGHGGTAAGVHAVAFDLDARLVPVAAHDPELHVGDLVLRRVRSGLPGVLRFVLADRDEIRRGMEVTLQYGDDEDTTRVVVLPPIDQPF